MQTKEEHTCRAKTEVYSRVVGFYRPTDQWNDGKREEFKDRVTYKVKEENNEHIRD